MELPAVLLPLVSADVVPSRDGTRIAIEIVPQCCPWICTGLDCGKAGANRRTAGLQMIVSGSRGIVVHKKRIGRDRTGFAESGHRAPGIAVDQVVGKHVVRTENTLLGDAIFVVVVKNVIETSGVVVAGGHAGVTSADYDS